MGAINGAVELVSKLRNTVIIMFSLISKMVLFYMNMAVGKCYISKQKYQCCSHTANSCLFKIDSESKVFTEDRIECGMLVRWCT